MLRTYVHEMNVETVDLGEEARVRVQTGLASPPVVIGRPIARERLNEGELHAVRRIGDGLLVRESRRCDAPAQLDQIRFGSLEAKWADRGRVSSLFCSSLGCSGWCH